MDNRGSNGGGSFEVEHGPDAAEVPMCIKQDRDRLDMWLEKERCGSKITPRLRTGESEVKVRDDEFVERCIAESGIFLIWSGKAKDDKLRFGGVKAEEV